MILMIHVHYFYCLILFVPYNNSYYDMLNVLMLNSKSLILERNKISLSLLDPTIGVNP